MLRGVLIFIFCTADALSAADYISPVPPPVGFIESSIAIPSLREKALLGRPKGTQLVGVYLRPRELAAMMRGEENRMSIFCRAYIANRAATEKDAEATFHMLVVNAQRETHEFNLEDPVTRRIIDSYTAATQQRFGQQTLIDGAIILGSIINTSNAYGQTMIVSTTSRNAQGEISTPVVATVAWVRHGTLILEMSDVASFTGEASILFAQEILMRWVKAVLDASQIP